MTTLALAGDTMLGRGVGQELVQNPRAPLFDEHVVELIASADACVLNLECCISDRGARFPDPRKPFFFRAPPVAAQRLAELGVSAVTLANNHALDYGIEALLDTLAHLEAVGIPVVGAGGDLHAARRAKVIRCGPLRLRLVAFSDHPPEFAAAPKSPGIAFAPLEGGPPDWVHQAARPGADADAVLVAPHWGPNMVPGPVDRVRAAARTLRSAGATLIAGHSAHVFHGAAPGVLFDLGDFLDDYATNRELRNDLGLLWLVDLDARGPRRIRTLPLALDYCFTRRAAGAEADAVLRLLRARCAPFGTEVEAAGDLLELRIPDPASA
ncbi:MAG: CapA family protein [Solirubrobacterales bacterium]|nr:CapA family protein [Solirubrobacterales bacterium]